MKCSLKVPGLALLLAVACASNASAIPTLLGYFGANSANVDANPSTETGIANTILGMQLGTSLPVGIPPFPADGTYFYIRNNTADPGTGSVSGPLKGAVGDNTIDAGFEYALARYDGPNGGYLLFYLGGAAETLPANSDGGGNFRDHDGVASTYGLSHYTGFNSNSVPDGGSTVALLGGALMILAGIARRGFSITEV